MFHTFEQIAIRVLDIEQAVSQLRSRTGYGDWVRDLVDAVHLFAHKGYDLGESFQVELAFNYDLVEGQELELIELRMGKTIQLDPAPTFPPELGLDLPALSLRPLSHLGYHVDDDSDITAAELRLTSAMRYWVDRQCPIIQLSQTMLHTGTKKRYRYAFADARALLGNWVKIIQRMPGPSNEASLIRGREAFAWLNDQV